MRARRGTPHPAPEHHRLARCQAVVVLAVCLPEVSILGQAGARQAQGQGQVRPRTRQGTAGKSVGVRGRRSQRGASAREAVSCQPSTTAWAWPPSDPFQQALRLPSQATHLYVDHLGEGHLVPFLAAPGEVLHGGRAGQAGQRWHCAARRSLLPAEQQQRMLQPTAAAPAPPRAPPRPTPPPPVPLHTPPQAPPWPPPPDSARPAGWR